MSHGRIMIPLVVLAVVAGRAMPQTASAPDSGPVVSTADACDSSAGPPACAPAQRIRVIVPPPEVIFAPSAKRCCGLFHHHNHACAESCAPAAACAPVQPVAPAIAPAVAPPGGGMMSFNMNLAMPYMTYQMTPMMMGSTGFAGAGMMGGAMGMPFGMGMPMIAPAGGINLGMGLGGGLQMGLGGNALAAALGLTGLTGLSNSGTSPLDMQLLRLLLGRASNNDGADLTRAAPAAAAAEGSLVTQMRAINAGIADITARINNELENARQMRKDLDDNSVLIIRLNKQLQDFEKRLDAVEKGEKKSGME